MKDKMWKMGRVAVVLIGLVALMAAALPGQAAPPQQAISGKIAPWVLEHTANGQEAEFLVVMAEQADLSEASRLSTKLDKGRYVRQALWDTAQASQQPLLAWLEARGVAYRSYYIVNLVWVKGDRDLALALAARPDVARIDGNPRIQNALPRPLASKAGPESPNQPAAVEANITYVHAPDVWAMGFNGQGIVVGGQDTGYDWDHPALINHYRGWDGAAASHDYNWHDSIHSGGGTCGADSPQPCDDDQHGTHTMGTVLGDDGVGNQVGMAPGARWIGCRNMDQGVGTPATYLECFEFFLAPYPVGGTPAQGDPSKAPDVTNNSWGCPTSEGCTPTSLQAAAEAQRAAGIMTVVSAGNDGPSCSTVQDPASIYAAVYSVGALQKGTDTIASFSSRGPVTVDGSNRRKPDISAPGTSIRSSVPGGGYEGVGWDGTSMAGPHVAGAVALLWSARPMLKNQVGLTEQILSDSAAHIASTSCSSSGWPNNVYGYGRLDVKAAVDSAPSNNGVLQGSVVVSGTTTPIAGAQLEATLSPTYTQSAVSDAGGLYKMVVPSGTYSLSVTAFGYLLQTIYPVGVVSGTTTTLDLGLEPAPSLLVSGTVTDASTGWPLYAAINIAGYPNNPVWSDPLTGFYSVTLPSGATYAFSVNAWVDGYQTGARDVTLTSNQVEDFALEVDALACNAPGYALAGVALEESFEIWPLPAGWEIVNNGGTCLWRAGSDGDDDTNQTGGTGEYADADSDDCGSGSTMNTELRTPVLDLSGRPDPTLEFKSDMRYYSSGGSEVWDVDMSLDGGATWPVNLLQRSGADFRGPETLALPMTGAGGQSNVRLRFHYYNAQYDYWWQVDDVRVSYGAASCQPLAGGLVVGNVYDANSSQLALNGASVENEDGYAAASLATPNDPAVDDGFYTLFSPAGGRAFSATLSGYGVDSAAVTVALSDTVRQDFYLPTGLASAQPTPLTAIVVLGTSSDVQLTISNLGGLAFDFELKEKAGGYTPARPLAGEDVLVVSVDNTAATAMETALTSLGYTYLDVESSAFQTMAVADLLTYKAVFYAGNTTGDSWAKAMQYLDNGGSLYISDNDLGYYSGSTTFYQQYLQASYIGDDGVQNGGGPATGLDIMSGLDLNLSSDPYPDYFSQNAEGVRIFQYVGGDGDGDAAGVAVDRAGYKAIYTSFDFNTMAANSDEVELVSRIMDFLANADPLPWLSQSPLSGTVSAGGNVAVNVTFDAGVPEVTAAGDYDGILEVSNNTPYGRLEVPVTMQVVEAAPVFEFSKQIQTDSSALSNGDIMTVTLIVSPTAALDTARPFTITDPISQEYPDLLYGLSIAGTAPATFDNGVLTWLGTVAPGDPLTQVQFLVAVHDFAAIPYPMVLTNTAYVQVWDPQGSLPAGSLPGQPLPSSPYGDRGAQVAFNLAPYQRIGGIDGTQVMTFYNPDNTPGVVISPTTAMGLVTVTQRYGMACTTNPPDFAVRHCYDIAVETDACAEVAFYYTPDEANGNQNPAARHWNGSSWDALPTLVSNPPNGGGSPAWWVRAEMCGYSPIILADNVPTAVSLQALAPARHVAWAGSVALVAAFGLVGLAVVAARRRR